MSVDDPELLNINVDRLNTTDLSALLENLCKKKPKCATSIIGKISHRKIFHKIVVDWMMSNNIDAFMNGLDFIFYFDQIFTVDQKLTTLLIQAILFESGSLILRSSPLLVY